MTNYQKLKRRYGNWLPPKDRIIFCYGIEKETKNLKTCTELNCNNCIFNEEIFEKGCGPVTEDWLDQEAEI